MWDKKIRSIKDEYRNETRLDYVISDGLHTYLNLDSVPVYLDTATVYLETKLETPIFFFPEICPL